MARLVLLGLQRMIQGASVDVAEHGAAAMARVGEGEEYDLVVCDIMMPVMDGARMIEALEALPSIPRVLVLTAVPERELADVLRRPHVVGYLQKPVDLLVLTDRVRQLLA